MVWRYSWYSILHSIHLQVLLRDREASYGIATATRFQVLQRRELRFRYVFGASDQGALLSGRVQRFAPHERGALPNAPHGSPTRSLVPKHAGSSRRVRKP